MMTHSLDGFHSSHLENKTNYESCVFIVFCRIKAWVEMGFTILLGMSAYNINENTLSLNHQFFPVLLSKIHMSLIKCWVNESKSPLLL